MPTKAASTRIDETLVYIGGYTQLDAQLVQDAHTLADGYIGRAQWNTGQYMLQGAAAMVKLHALLESHDDDRRHGPRKQGSAGDAARHLPAAKRDG
jgi:hypothetical protein